MGNIKREGKRKKEGEKKRDVSSFVSARSATPSFYMQEDRPPSLNRMASLLSPKERHELPSQLDTHPP